MKSKYFSSQTKETELTKLDIKGGLPDWVNGKLIRNGPAQFEVGKTKFKHWFDGLGMLHSFDIQNGEILYHSKFIKSTDYLKLQKDQNATISSWGTPIDPCKSIFEKLSSTFTSNPTNTNVNIAKIGDKFFTTSDISTINEFGINTLETLGQKSLGKSAVAAAHPSFDLDKSVWNLASSFSPKNPINKIIKFNEESFAQTQAIFSTEKSFYTHSFGNTEDYFIVIEQPLYLSFWDLITSAFKRKSYYECYKWHQKATNILHIFHKPTKTITKIQTKESFFFFHTVNSFEKNGKIIIDLCGYKNSKIVDDFYLEVLENKGISAENKSELMRLNIDLKTNETSLEHLGVNIELPCLNHYFGTKDYNFLYGIHSTSDSSELSNAIIKYQHNTKEQKIWKSDQLLPGEPVFVSSPNSKIGDNVEDDGILLVICFEKSTQKTCLVVLSAKTMTEIARSYTPNFIPAGLHGSFYKLHK